MHKVMENNSLLLFALFIIFCVSISQEVDDEHEFSYDVNKPNGPNHWGEIHPDWHMCSHGDMQSPIDLTRKRVVRITSKLGRLYRDYKPANATLINRGHDMMLSWIGRPGHLHINGTKYKLNQVHWHTPSEHTINGKKFNLELHMVHRSTNKKVAVVGILYKIGRSDSFLTTMKPYLRALASIRDVETSVGIIDPQQIKFGSRKYYRYIGSLTTPPCDQDVIWTIVQKVRTISREQLRIIRKAIHEEIHANARPIQALNNRWLKLYIPNDDETN